MQCFPSLVAWYSHTVLTQLHCMSSTCCTGCVASHMYQSHISRAEERFAWPTIQRRKGGCAPKRGMHLRRSRTGKASRQDKRRMPWTAVSFGLKTPLDSTVPAQHREIHK